MKDWRLILSVFLRLFPHFFPKHGRIRFSFSTFLSSRKPKTNAQKNILVKRKGSLFSAIMSTGRICPCLNDTEGGKASGDSNTGSNSDSTAPARHSGKERNCNSFFVLNYISSTTCKSYQNLYIHHPSLRVRISRDLVNAEDSSSFALYYALATLTSSPPQPWTSLFCGRDSYSLLWEPFLDSKYLMIPLFSYPSFFLPLVSLGCPDLGGHKRLVYCQY